jgi:hypothetical protein
MADKQKEAYKLIDHINKTVRNGFSASVRPDNSILVSYSGYDIDFEMSLEFSIEYLCWMVDNNQYSVRGLVPSMAMCKGQIGFITMALAKYNVALNKRLSK